MSENILNNVERNNRRMKIIISRVQNLYASPDIIRVSNYVGQYGCAVYVGQG